MDTVFHIVLALAGGYILVKGLGVCYKLWVLVLLAFLSLSLDVLSVIQYFIYVLFDIGTGSLPLSHNIFLVIVIPLIFSIIIYIQKNKKLQVYTLVFMVMLISHLLVDMITIQVGGCAYNLYGIPLFYPLSKTLYLIPDWRMDLLEGSNDQLISSPGIALALYLGIIALMISLRRFYLTQEQETD